mgnify:CR=1 FL=1
MKKYIALLDMPNWGKGIVVDINANTGFIKLEGLNRWIYNKEIKFLLDYGWIKEFEPLEFTESDVRKAIEDYFNSAFKNTVYLFDSSKLTEIINELRNAKK